MLAMLKAFVRFFGPPGTTFVALMAFSFSSALKYGFSPTAYSKMQSRENEFARTDSGNTRRDSEQSPAIGVFLDFIVYTDALFRRNEMKAGQENGYRNSLLGHINDTLVAILTSTIGLALLRTREHSCSQRTRLLSQGCGYQNWMIYQVRPKAAEIF